MADFKPGDIVRSIIHSDEAALFMLAVEDYASPIPPFMGCEILLVSIGSVAVAQLIQCLKLLNR